MPRRKEVLIYKFSELAPKVREKVLDRLRPDAFQPEWLTEQLKNILMERGFEDPDVCWSLGYCQGDGVAWKGHLDTTVFFHWAIEGDDPAYSERMKASDVERFLPLRGRVSVNVSYSGRYCHWNSMEVEIELAVNFVDLVPDDLRGPVLDYLSAKEYANSRHFQAMYDWNEARMKPIRDWQRRKDEREQLMRKGPKEWKPPIGPRPKESESGPEPVLRLPEVSPEVLGATEKAEADWKTLDEMTAKFREYLDSWVKDTSRELEKLGYSEIEYAQSNEQLIETIEANDLEFYEDGRIAR